MTREGRIRFRVRCSGYGVNSSLWSDDPLAFLVPSLIRAPVSADEDAVDNVLVLVFKCLDSRLVNICIYSSFRSIVAPRLLAIECAPPIKYRLAFLHSSTLLQMLFD